MNFLIEFTWDNFVFRKLVFHTSVLVWKYDDFAMCFGVTSVCILAKFISMKSQYNWIQGETFTLSQNWDD